MLTALETTKVQAALARCRHDPHRFNEVFLSAKRPDGSRKRPSYWSSPAARGGQVGLCRAVARHRVVVVYSGNAIGKDYWVGGIVPWWLYTRRDSLVIVTGPTQTVIGSVTWKEIRRAIAACPLPPPRISSGIKASPALVEIAPGWRALGYSTTSVERASGQHAKDLLVIVEEASGVEEEIWDAIESLKYSKLVAIGNPVRAEGRFVDLIRQAEADRADGVPESRAVCAIRIPSTDSPHADLEMSPYGLADRTWLEARYRRYGRDSLWVRSHIVAIIPELSSEALIPSAWLDYPTSVVRPSLPPSHPVHRSRRIAIDLGEGVGRDDTAILVRDDHGILDLVAGHVLSLADAAAEAARLARVYNVAHNRISYDKLGIGRDFGNHLARHGIVEAVGYVGSGRPRQPKAFPNLRSEAAWNLRRRLNPDWALDPAAPASSRQVPIAIPARAWWPLLREDLEALSYDLVGGQTRLIKKADLMVRLGRSPDRGDALIQ